MARIAFIGAGSTVFTRNLVGDVLRRRELADTTTFALMDVDAERLETSEAAVRAMARAAGARAGVEVTLDRRVALDGADYVVTSFQIGGYRPATVVDFDVPKRFGLRQTIGDTVGVGGIMRGLRTIPVLLDICRDMEELCPDALLLQYVNPMAMLCWAVARASSVRAVGLCHSVQHTAGELAADLGLAPEELDYEVAGINHLAFFLRLERDGQDLYPALREVTPPAANRVRYEVLRHLGSFVTESSEHFAEYVPWFIKAARPDLVERFNIPLDEYPRRCEAQIAEWDALRARLRNGAEPRCRRRPASSTARTSSARARPASRSPSTATSPTRSTAAASSTRCPRTAASRCRAWPASAGSSPGASARCRASSRRSCRPTSTSRGSPSMRRSRATATPPATRRCSTRTRVESLRSTRSPRSSTR